MSSILAGIFILYGTTVFLSISKSTFKIIYGDNYLFMPSFWLIGALLDWGGFALGGWLIGRLFPTHSMRITAIAGFAFVISITLKDFSGESVDKLTAFLNGLVERGLVKQRILDDNLLSVRAGGVIGGAARAYLAIIMARIASRKRLKSVIDA